MTPLDTLLARGRDEGLFHHAALSVRTRDGRRLDSTTDSRAAPARVFDVASVTKVFTATLVQRLLDVDSTTTFVQGAPTLAALLSHSSGLPAWRPLFAHAAETLERTPAQLVADPSLHPKVLATYRDVIAATTCDAPRPTYSDLGFLTLGFELEARTGRSLDTLLRDELLLPLGLDVRDWGFGQGDTTSTGTGRPRGWIPDIEGALVTRTGRTPDAIDTGPDDDNSACAGGRTGHAGIHATAEGVARLGLTLLHAAAGDSTFLSRDRAASMFTRHSGTRTLGLDTPSGDTPAIGTVLGRGPLGAAGHLGFTGCSLWMDRDAGVSIALLTDAVTLERPAVKLRSFRPIVHDAVAAALR